MSLSAVSTGTVDLSVCTKHGQQDFTQGQRWLYEHACTERRTSPPGRAYAQSCSGSATGTRSALLTGRDPSAVVKTPLAHCTVCLVATSIRGSQLVSSLARTSVNTAHLLQILLCRVCWHSVCGWLFRSEHVGPIAMHRGPVSKRFAFLHRAGFIEGQIARFLMQRQARLNSCHVSDYRPCSR